MINLSSKWHRTNSLSNLGVLLFAEAKVFNGLPFTTTGAKKTFSTRESYPNSSYDEKWLLQMPKALIYRVIPCFGFNFYLPSVIS